MSEHEKARLLLAAVKNADALMAAGCHEAAGLVLREALRLTQ